MHQAVHSLYCASADVGSLAGSTATWDQSCFALPPRLPCFCLSPLSLPPPNLECRRGGVCIQVRFNTHGAGAEVGIALGASQQSWGERQKRGSVVLISTDRWPDRNLQSPPADPFCTSTHLSCILPSVITRCSNLHFSLTVFTKSG